MPQVEQAEHPPVGEQTIMGEILSRHRIQFPSSLWIEVEVYCISRPTRGSRHQTLEASAPQVPSSMPASQWLPGSGSHHSDLLSSSLLLPH